VERDCKAKFTLKEVNSLANLDGLAADIDEARHSIEYGAVLEQG